MNEQQEPTIESALEELRQMFKHVSLKITLCKAPGCRAYRYVISPQLVSMEPDPEFHSDSLPDCMAQVRAWHESQSVKE